MLDTLARDLRHGARTLLKNPGFTVVSALTLALGVGGCAAMYAYIQQLVLWDHPYPDLGSLVVVQESDSQHPGSSSGISARAFEDILTQSGSFEGIAGYNTDGFVLAGDDGMQILEGVLVTPNMFDLLGVQPLLGRTFHEGEKPADIDSVVVLGERAWMRHFGRRTDVVGSTIELSRKPYTVIGVMPEHFWPGRDLWMPLGIAPSRAGRLRTWARLNQSGAHRLAQAELDVVSERLARDDPGGQGTWRLMLLDPFEMSGGQLGTLGALIVAPVGLVFLIACVNIAHLQLGRDVQRSREMAIRRALGAGRLRLMRQLLTESLLLAFMGGALGVLVASLGIDAISAYLPGGYIESLGKLEVDGNALLFLVILSAGSGVLFGLLPAVRVSGLRLSSALKEGTGQHTSRGSFRSLLVVSELAFSMMLLVGTGMAIVLFQYATHSDLGFDEKNLWTARLSLRGPGLGEAGSKRSWSSSTLEQVRAVPGVVSASIATELPLIGGHRRRFEAMGQSPASNAMAQAEYRAVSDDYFETLRIPLRMGRTFNDEDREGSMPVVIVNETLARRYFSGRAVGKQLRTFTEDDPFGARRIAPADVREVVGVVADVRQTIDAQAAPPIVYVPYPQDPVAPLSLVVRTQLPPDEVVPAILDRINAPSPKLVLLSMFVFERRIRDSVRAQQFLPFSMAVFAFFGVVLAGVGLYGTTSRAAAQRTREFGIRQALGARGADLLGLVIGQSARGAAIGLALGTAGSIAAARLFLAVLEPQERSAFGVDLLRTSEVLLAGLAAAALLTAVVLLATYIPARRATKVDPTTALRYE